jgi:microcystin degradation protein MlrC
MAMRIGIVAWLQECNTFVDSPTTLEHFRQDVLATGPEVIDRFAGGHHEVSGFLRGLEAEGLEPVPLLAARAIPWGPVDAATWRQMTAMLERQLDQAGELDGILAAPHGAMVCDPCPDADGQWVGQLRRRLGPAKPIVATIDPHANLSRSLVDAADALIAYRTNPHVDQAARGMEAARLIAGALRGEVRPVQAAAFPPMAIGIDRQCTDQEPLASLFRLADSLRTGAGMLSNSIVLGFPYADVPHMGSSAIAITDGDPALARAQALELAREMWRSRTGLIGEHIGVDEAIDRATNLTGRVCLLDTGDNVGGGSPGDGTLLAHALHRRSIADAFVCLCDPTAVRRATQAGVGARIELAMGGHTDIRHGPPLHAPVRVIGLHAGDFDEPEPRHGAFSRFDQGPTAVVRSDRGLTIMLTSRRMAPFSLRQISAFDLDPASFRLLVAKGVNAPIAAYRAVCEHFIRVATPGVTASDMRLLGHRMRRRPMFPFEADAPFGL